VVVGESNEKDTDRLHPSAGNVNARVDPVFGSIREGFDIPS
jgi:hypothetical protein